MIQVKYFIVILILSLLTVRFSYALEISEGIYEGGAHYIIETR